MMERLTFVKSPKYWNEGRHPTKYTSRKTFQEVVDRLAYYEDMEEQGRLVVLPYQTGQVVWVIRSQTSNGKNLYLREERIERYVVSKDDVFMCFESGRVSVSSWHWKTSVFLTREEAEKALKEGADHA